MTDITHPAVLTAPEAEALSLVGIKPFAPTSAWGSAFKRLVALGYARKDGKTYAITSLGSARLLNPASLLETKCDRCNSGCYDVRQRDGQRVCLTCVSREADARIAKLEMALAQARDDARRFAHAYELATSVVVREARE